MSSKRPTKQQLWDLAIRQGKDPGKYFNRHISKIKTEELETWLKIRPAALHTTLTAGEVDPAFANVPSTVEVGFSDDPPPKGWSEASGEVIHEDERVKVTAVGHDSLMIEGKDSGPLAAGDGVDVGGYTISGERHRTPPTSPRRLVTDRQQIKRRKRQQRKANRLAKKAQE